MLEALAILGIAAFVVGAVYAVYSDIRKKSKRRITWLMEMIWH